MTISKTTSLTPEISSTSILITSTACSILKCENNGYYNEELNICKEILKNLIYQILNLNNSRRMSL
jgi:hypothetical protein